MLNFNTQDWGGWTCQGVMSAIDWPAVGCLVDVLSSYDGVCARNSSSSSSSPRLLGRNRNGSSSVFGLLTVSAKTIDHPPPHTHTHTHTGCHATCTGRFSWWTWKLNLRIFLDFLSSSSIQIQKDIWIRVKGETRCLWAPSHFWILNPAAKSYISHDATG